MELKLKDTTLNLANGVDPNKFITVRPIAVSASAVKEAFTRHGYNLDEMPGVFVKAFNLNAQELREVEDNLQRIDELGMQEVFNKNLKIKYFRNKFIERLVWCINHGLPYLNQDGTFAAFFDDAEEYAKYTASVPMEKVKTREEVDNNPEMTDEGRQVYNEVVERLNYLVLENPTDEYLVQVVNNACQKVVPAIIRCEYRYINLYDMIESIMFDGLDVTPEQEDRIKGLVSGAFQDQERKVA